jgi:hypothetical protein
MFRTSIAVSLITAFSSIAVFAQDARRELRWHGLLHVAVFVTPFFVAGFLSSIAAAQDGAIISGRAKAKDGDSVLIGSGSGSPSQAGEPREAAWAHASSG